MANVQNMVDQQFESKKNWKATSYTALIISILLAFFILWRWQLPALEYPPVEEGIEVNLGNSDQGLGEDQAFLPGKPAPSDAQAYTPPQKSEPVKEEDVKDIATDDKHDDAPEIKKPPVIKPKPEATKVPEKEVVKNKPVKNPQPETTPTPPAPKPKAVFKGVNGTGTGGNEADSYKKGGNQGIAGGSGDQGRPGGDPDSKNYTGGGKGSGGVRPVSGLGNRRVTAYPTFNDEFNENGKVMVAVTFSPSGGVINVEIVQRGTTGEANLKEIAKRKARQLKISADENANSEQTVVFEMNFKLKS